MLPSTWEGAFLIEATLGELLGIVPVIEDWKPDAEEEIEPISKADPIIDPAPRKSDKVN